MHRSRGVELVRWGVLLGGGVIAAACSASVISDAGVTAPDAGQGGSATVAATGGTPAGGSGATGGAGATGGGGGASAGSAGEAGESAISLGSGCELAPDPDASVPRVSGVALTFNAPTPNLLVSAGGKTVATDALGRFCFDGLARPYDLEVEFPAVKQLWRFEGLSRDAVVVNNTNISTWHTSQSAIMGTCSGPGGPCIPRYRFRYPSTLSELWLPTGTGQLGPGTDPGSYSGSAEWLNAPMAHGELFGAQLLSNPEGIAFGRQGFDVTADGAVGLALTLQALPTRHVHGAFDSSLWIPGHCGMCDAPDMMICAEVDGMPVNCAYAPAGTYDLLVPDQAAVRIVARITEYLPESFVLPPAYTASVSYPLTSGRDSYDFTMPQKLDTTYSDPLEVTTQAVGHVEISLPITLAGASDWMVRLFTDRRSISSAGQMQLRPVGAISARVITGTIDDVAGEVPPTGDVIYDTMTGYDGGER